MLKRLALFLTAVALALSVGCTTPPGSTDPAAAAITATTNAANALEAAITAADAAHTAGALKTADARKALDGFAAAQRGIRASLDQLRAAQAARAASGAKP